VLNPFWIFSFGRALMLLEQLINSQWEYLEAPWFRELRMNPFAYHARLSLRFGCGALFTLAVVPALAFAVWRGGTARLIALAAFGQFAVLAANPLLLTRNFEPIVPGLSLLVAYGAVALVAQLRVGPFWCSALLLVLGIVLLAEPLTSSVRLGQVLHAVDTREMATSWIRKNIPQGARIVSWGAPVGCEDLGRPEVGWRKVYQRLDPAMWTTEHASFLVWHHYQLPFSSDPLPQAAQHARLLAKFDPFTESAADPVLEPYDAFYLPLGNLGGVVRPGPIIEIFALTP
jgi:hypothetical protein